MSATAATTPLIFDGHNDVLLQLYRAGGLSETESFLSGRDSAIDLPKAMAGGFGGGFFAVYIPSPIDKEFKMEEMAKPSYDLPLPEAIDWEDALPVATAIAAILFDLENKGALKVCRSVADIRVALADNKIAAIFHIEGAEAIDQEFTSMYVEGLASRVFC